MVTPTAISILMTTFKPWWTEVRGATSKAYFASGNQLGWLSKAKEVILNGKYIHIHTYIHTYIYTNIYTHIYA